jgi:hypothetical protein
MKNELKNIQRNPFVALCDYASRGNWCRNIYWIQYCGHNDFQIAFSKIIHGQHPDNESFWPYGKKITPPFKEMKEYRDFHGGASIVAQMKLASIIAKAKISDIQAVAKFPDWLGYMGLIFHHCPCYDSQKIISDAFLPQLINLVKDYRGVYEYLQEKQSKQELLNINDFGRIESCFVGVKK